MGRTVIAAALAALAVGAGACGRQAPEPPWPEGTLLVARRDGLAALLGQLSQGDTRLAERARRLAEGLPECDRLGSQLPSTSLLQALEALDCAADGADLARLHELRGTRDAAFSLSLASGGHAVGSVDSHQGDVEVEVSLPAASLSGARRLLLPGSAPGPGVLSADEALIHARLRPHGGLDLASLVPEDSQGDDLFRLKSRLFSGWVLDGTWELAVYLAREGRPMPDAALALGFRQRAAALAAMQGFIDELRGRWPVHPSPFRVGEAEGACVLDLGLLPGLAPCYVATGDALVIGWNPGSLQRALTGDGERGPRAALVIDLARLPEADARLAAQRGIEAAPQRWPWRSLRAEGERRGDALRLRAYLEGGA